MDPPFRFWDDERTGLGEGLPVPCSIETMVILRKRVPGATAATLDRFLRKGMKSVGIRGTVNVLVTSSRELQSLNAQFRHKDKPTDVLSFPPLSTQPQDFSGDIAISGEIAAQSAKVLGHATADEVKILILHGLLHLAGHDHERDSGVMARKEQRLRRILGLPIGLIERAEKVTSSLKKRKTP